MCQVCADIVCITLMYSVMYVRACVRACVCDFYFQILCL